MNNGKYPINEPLPRYKKQFDELSEEEQNAIIAVQVARPYYWWNPDCTYKCLHHKVVHKYSFEAYIEGWVNGYFGCDTVGEMLKVADDAIKAQNK